MNRSTDGTSEPQGLGQAEAQARLQAEGPNELTRAKRRSPLRIVFEVLREPMLALLLGGGVVYLLLGNREEALILLLFACLSIAITVVQEARTERVMDALRDLTSPRAMVIRDGVRQRIAGREVVVGDVIVLSEGDRVARPRYGRAPGGRGFATGILGVVDRGRGGDCHGHRHRAAHRTGQDWHIAGRP